MLLFMKPITSLQNPRVKQAVKLRQKRERDRTSTFLIEGYRELSRAIQAKVPIEIVFYSPDHFLGTNETTLLQNVDALEVSKEVFEKMSYRDRPDGLLAIAQQVPKTLADLNLPEERPPFLLIAEAIEKPGNLGTILRSSAPPMPLALMPSLSVIGVPTSITPMLFGPVSALSLPFPFLKSQAMRRSLGLKDKTFRSLPPLPMRRSATQRQT